MLILFTSITVDDCAITANKINSEQLINGIENTFKFTRDRLIFN